MTIIYCVAGFFLRFDARSHLALGHLEDVAHGRGEIGELERIGWRLHGVIIARISLFEIIEIHSGFLQRFQHLMY